MTQSTTAVLIELKELLLLEKEALIQNKSKEVMEIFKKKETIIPALDTATFEEQDKEIVQELALEIKELQEVNNMLLEQSMEYNKTFLDAFQKAQKKNTYSKEGSLKKSESTGILDQSL